MHVPPHDGLNDITNWRGIIPQWRHNGGEFENEQGNWSDFHGNGGNEHRKKKKKKSGNFGTFVALRCASVSFFLFRLDLT